MRCFSLPRGWSLSLSVVIGEAVASERLTSRSLDSQLIRLGTRLVGFVAAVAILIEGGDEFGLPAYSVLAGLGVGGLAVALAARDTIANLIGSLLITSKSRSASATLSGSGEAKARLRTSASAAPASGRRTTRS